MERHTARRIPGRLHSSIPRSSTALAALIQWLAVGHARMNGASAIGLTRWRIPTLIGELCAGGMAVVFIASQDHPQRIGARKADPRRGIATQSMLRRFEREGASAGAD